MLSSESKVGGLPEATVSANEIAVMRKHVGQWVPTSNIVDAILEMKELTAVAAHLPYRSHPMSDENVGGLVELPPLPDIGPEGWYTRADMIAYARATLSTHGQPPPRVTQEMANSLHETAQLLDEVDRRSEARREKYGLHGQPVVDEAWLRQAIEEFKYLAGRTDFPMQDRERWRALTAALKGATP